MTDFNREGTVLGALDESKRRCVHGVQNYKYTAIDSLHVIYVMAIDRSQTSQPCACQGHGSFPDEIPSHGESLCQVVCVEMRDIYDPLRRAAVATQLRQVRKEMRNCCQAICP